VIVFQIVCDIISLFPLHGTPFGRFRTSSELLQIFFRFSSELLQNFFRTSSDLLQTFFPYTPPSISPEVSPRQLSLKKSMSNLPPLAYISKTLLLFKLEENLMEKTLK